MKFIYCPTCGDILTQKEIGDEGMVPFCTKCNKPLFDMPYACTLTIVINEFNEIALIKQGYVAQEHYVCVAGYVKSGENAEDTAQREVMEELGLKVDKINYVNSYYYAKRDLLMLGFAARVKKADFRISSEVDKAEWFSTDQALTKLKPGSIAMDLMKDYFKLKDQL